MRRKIFFWLVVVVVLKAFSSAQAQQPTKMPRLGYLLTLTPDQSLDLKAFRQGLAALGYVEGKNIFIEYRSAEGKLDRLPDLAAELVALKVAIIVALAPPAARAAKNATKTIPIVMRSTDDPVASGLVDSLARPGGNVTGLTSISTDLIGKRLEILKETVSGANRVAVLRNPTAPDAALKWQEVQLAGRALKLQLQSVEVSGPEDFANAFKNAMTHRAQALFVLRNPLIVNNRSQISELAVRNRLPAIYDDREFVDAGGLMAYGADLADLHRRAATYVDKILKGAKPADLPVEQPMKFEFIVNLKAAKQIGLIIPPNVLARADKVIK
ncbi:MAG TPA: ABC transporter substrate-binding protein [Candidatus Binatia bacterium]